MTREGNLHPADERALADLFALARRIAARLAPGRRTEVVIERQRGEGRLTGRITETHFPVEDEVSRY
jgi:hypothetical protein